MTVANIQRKNFTITDLSIKEDAATEEYFYFEGYASTFGNEDFGGDVVVKGAFVDSLKELPATRVKLLWQHSSYEPIGSYTEMFEDEKGLFVRGRLPKAHSEAANCIALLKCGAIDSMSIGYTILEDRMEAKSRLLLKVKLWEVSLVTFPMNDKATITGTKALKKQIKRIDIEKCTTKRELEDYLRDSGSVSNKAATILASWFPEKQSDSVDEEKSIVELTQRISNLLQNKIN